MSGKDKQGRKGGSSGRARSQSFSRSSDSRSPNSRSPSQTRSRSGSADKSLCIRCGSLSHKASQCWRLAYCKTKCKVCDSFIDLVCVHKKEKKPMDANQIELEQDESMNLETNLLGISLGQPELNGLEWGEDLNGVGQTPFERLTLMPEWDPDVKQ